MQWRVYVPKVWEERDRQEEWWSKIESEVREDLLKEMRENPKPNLFQMEKGNLQNEEREKSFNTFQVQDVWGTSQG